MSWMSLVATSLLWTLQALPLVDATTDEMGAAVVAECGDGGEEGSNAIELTVSGVEEDSPFARAKR